MNAINELENKYTKLFKDGKLVQIHIAKWGMHCQLSKEDLGLEEEALPTIFKLGNKMLVKKEVLAKFTSLEQKARTYLKLNSHEFPIAQAHFVPRKNLISVINKLQQYKREYEVLIEDFVTNYNTYKEEMLAAYPDYREKLEPFYPAVESVRVKFSFDISIFEVSLPKKFKETDLLAIQAKDAAIADLKVRYEQEMENQYQKGIANINNFLSQTVGELRGQIVEIFETVASKIRKREVISKTNLNSLKNVIDNFRNLDFLDDKAINSKLDPVVELIESDYDFKENQAAIKRLGASLNDVLETAKNISDIDNITGEYLRKIDI